MATATPDQSPSPPPSVAYGSWPFFLPSARERAFAPDGTLYVSFLPAGSTQRPISIAAIDPSAKMRPGWPVTLSAARTWLQGFEVAPDGSLAILGCAPDASACALLRFQPDGSIRPGWPFEPAQTNRCGGIAVRPDGSIFLACGTEEETTVALLDPAGRVTRSSTVQVPSPGDARLGADGTLYVAGWLNEGAFEQGLRLAAIAPDGSVPAGWPVEVPSLAGGYEVGSDGTVYVWWTEGIAEDICHLGERTLYQAIGRDGRLRPGWPYTTPGWTSPARPGQDGTLYFVTQADEVVALDAAGRIKDGWPAAVRGNTGSCFGPNPPYLGDDGTVYVITAGESPEGGITALDPDGRLLPGWPYRPDGVLAYPCVNCTPGPAEPLAPVSSDGFLYVAEYPSRPDPGSEPRLRLVALDRQARLMPDAPVVLPADASEIGLLERAPDGRVFVHYAPWPWDQWSAIFPLGAEAVPPAGWSQREQEIRAGIRPDLRGSCSPRRDGLPAGAVAAVECGAETDLVRRERPDLVEAIGFFGFESDQAMRDAYLSSLARYGVEPESGGSCESGERGEHELTSEGSSPESTHRVGCFVNEFGVANIRWAIAGTPVYVGVLGRNADIAQLYRWTTSEIYTPATTDLWLAPL